MSPADPVDAFADTCERFLSLCTDEPLPEKDLLRALRSTLAELVARVDDLPDEEGPYDVAEELDDDELRERIGPRFPSLGPYHDYAPIDEDDAPWVGDAIDDLVDTYAELFCGLEHYRAGRRRDAAGHWRFGFDAHWGSHAIGALRDIHQLLQRDAWLSPTDPEPDDDA